MDKFEPGEVEDLATLARLDEKVLLNELKVRYNNDKIYTYVGDILVALNPFKDVGIYGKEESKKYNMLRRGELPPHIFGVADTIYQDMLGIRGTKSKNQCILISGESGAGKTESTKFIIRQLMELCHGNSQLEQQILQVNPLLEAFGNAQTLMNDNSSRFGKYIDMRFSQGKVIGSKISEYLLEKSRLVRQSRGEQNFHIFYYMFAGLTPEQQNKYGLGKLETYKYFSDGASCLKTNLNTLKNNYEELLNAMDMVGFNDEEQDNMFHILSGALSTGNIEFEECDNDVCSIKSMDKLRTVADQLCLDCNELRGVLTCSRTFTKGEEIKRHYNHMQATDSRDAVAKAVYGRLFSWIVNKINRLLAPHERLAAEEIREIGLLDIFGFEHFEVNSFEQACINLANEQLQFFFNKHIFMLEQEEYSREGVDWTEIKYVDNQSLLDLFLAKPIGLLTLLDEESQFPKGSDQSFVDKLNEKFKRDEHYTMSAHANSGTFTIHHYAGNVIYNANGWLEKNRDTLPPGVKEILQNSTNKLLSLIFKGKISRTGSLVHNMSRKSRHSTAKHIKAQATAARERKLTVGAQFRNSLNVLMEKMSSAQPVFIRCIKPNGQKAPKKFEDDYVEAQLLYTGMLETTQIRRKGFAVRPTFAEFVDRYHLLAKGSNCPPNAESCRNILAATKLTGWQIGKTKVFLKYFQIDRMVELMDEMAKQAVHLQRVARGFLARRRVKRLKLEAKKQKEMANNLLQQVTDVSKKFHELQMQKINEDKSIPKDFFNKRSQEAFIMPTLESDGRAGIAVDESSSEESDDSEDTIKPISDKEKHKFGIPGTKDATVQWFKLTQSVKVKKPQGGFAEWFHGIITRRDTERMLWDKIVGCFLLRVSESRFGYSLSFRAEDRCRHYMIDQTVAGKYIVIGEPKVHRNLWDLVEFHQDHPLSNWNGTLTIPCGQEEGQCDYSDLIEMSMKARNSVVESQAGAMRQARNSQVSQSHNEHRPSNASLAPALPERNYGPGRGQEPFPKKPPSGTAAKEAYESLLSSQTKQNEDDGIKRRITTTRGTRNLFGKKK